VDFACWALWDSDRPPSIRRPDQPPLQLVRGSAESLSRRFVMHAHLLVLPAVIAESTAS
jgi:hypothetical protein